MTIGVKPAPWPYNIGRISPEWQPLAKKLASVIAPWERHAQLQGNLNMGAVLCYDLITGNPAVLRGGAYTTNKFAWGVGAGGVTFGRTQHWSFQDGLNVGEVPRANSTKLSMFVVGDSPTVRCAYFTGNKAIRYTTFFGVDSTLHLWVRRNGYSTHAVGATALPTGRHSFGWKVNGSTGYAEVYLDGVLDGSGTKYQGYTVTTAPGILGTVAGDSYTASPEKQTEIAYLFDDLLTADDFARLHTDPYGLVRPADELAAFLPTPPTPPTLTSIIHTSRTRAIGNRAPKGPVSLNRGSPLTQGLVGSWPLMRASSTGNGALASDELTGASGRAALTSDTSGLAPSIASSAFGSRVYDFPGGGTAWYLDCGDHAANHVQAHTFSCWVSPDTLTGYQVLGGIGKFITIGGIEWAIYGNALGYAYYDGSIRGWYTSASAGMVVGNTYHLSIAWTPGTVEFYVDGRSLGTVATTSGTIIYTSSSNTYIARAHGSNPRVNGKLWGVTFHNRALSAAEVWALYSPQTRWDLYWQRRRTYFLPAVTTPPATPIIHTSRTRAIGNHVPVNTSQVSHSSELTKGLQSLVLPSLHDAVRKDSAVPYGNPVMAAHPWGQVLDFDGTDDYVDLGTAESRGIDANVGTVLVWVDPYQWSYANTSDAKYVFYKPTASGNLFDLAYVSYSGSTTYWRAQLRGHFGGTMTATHKLTSDAELQRMQLVGFRYDIAAGLDLIIDGRVVASSTTTTNALTLTQQFYLGHPTDFSGGEAWQMLRMMIWNRWLSDGELAALYSPQRRWSMEQQVGRTYSLPATTPVATPIIHTSRTRAIGNRAPHGPLVLDRSSPQARDIARLYPLWSMPPAGSRDLVVGDPLTVEGAGSAFGRTADPDTGTLAPSKTAQTKHLTLATPLTLAASDASSVAWRAYRRSGSSAVHGMFCGKRSVTTSFIWMFEGSQLTWRRNNYDFVFTSDPTFNDGFHDYVMSYVPDGSGGSDVYAYKDGVSLGTSHVSSTKVFYLSQIFDGYTNYSFDFDGALTWLGVWNRELTNEDAWKLHAPQSRWDLYWQRKRTFFLPAAAAPGGGFAAAWARIRSGMIGVGVH